jgi:glycosyltransferase involved in cell wall biosynthesis
MRDVHARFAGRSTRPRVVVVGSYRMPLGAADEAALDALSRVAAVHPVDASPTPMGMLRALRGASRAVGDGCEAVHLLDARLAVPALAVRRRYGVPVTATLTNDDLVARRSRAAMLRRLDDVFVHGDAASVQAAARSMPVSFVPPLAPAIPAPTPRRLASMARLVRDGTPGRLVVAAPWPSDPEQVRWCRDSVVPLLQGNPLWVFLGAPGRRQVRLMAGAIGMKGSFRAHIGAIDADVVAAAARCADVFVLCGDAARARASTQELLLALIASKVPLVAGGGVDCMLAEHETNAFVVAPGDASGLVSTLNRLLALPAVQRHYLGEEFADHVARRYTWDTAAEVYGERLAALVGRPQIPLELRAA